MSPAAVADPPEDMEEMMSALGYVTTIILTAAGIALGVLAVKSLPETRRYLAMRKICRRPAERPDAGCHPVRPCVAARLA